MAMLEVPLKVAVRLRPLVGRENPDQLCIRVQPDKKQIILGKDRAFTFDYIFAPDSEQIEVFETLCVPLIKQCFQGYNGTIFAYGQTGSGKTHTIEGESDEVSQMGIIPRSIDFIFKEIDSLQVEHLHNYSVKVSFIEIYKEELHDLLDSESYPFKNLHIREDEKGNTTVVNAREICCSSAEEVLAYAEQGATMRRTEATQMNERSSRSHSIFTLILERRGETKSKLTSEVDCLSSKIHFVDLAGSERASKTGNIGERFKESIHINTGLLALGNVISALSDQKRKSGHIPYRDAKITRLLKDSLGGNSNTVMITCVSPTFNNFDESLNSLKYANRAKNIRNKPIVNRDSQSMRFEALQSEIMSLKEELEREKSSKTTHQLQNEDNVVALESKLESATNNEHRLKDAVLVAKYLLNQKCSVEKSDESFVHAVECWNQSLADVRVGVPKIEDLVSAEIDKLQNQVKQLTADLALDEQIFNQKAQEMTALSSKLTESRNRELAFQDENQKLRQELIACKNHIKEQQDVILELQKIVNEQKQSMEISQTQNPYQGDNVPRPAKSAPVRRVNDHQFPHGDARNFHTSPSVYNMDKIVQSFRAKSQMLATQWEESDEVLRDNFDDEEAGENERSSKVRGSNPGRDSKGTVYGESSVQPLQRPTSNWSVTKIKSAANAAHKPIVTTKKAIVTTTTMQQLLKLPEINSLRASANYSKEDIDKANCQIKEANKKMRELALAIRLKEELMREMIKTGKEASTAKKVLKEHSNNKEWNGSGETASGKHNAINSTGKRGATGRDASGANLAASIQNQVDKKVSDLTVELHKMRSQYDLVQKRLKEESDKKAAMEKGMIANTHKVKELETKLDQQQKILKRRNEEVNAMRKSKRPNFSPNRSGGAQDNSPGTEMEAELEKMMQKKQYLSKLEEELKRREDLIAEKEVAMQEKAQIEVKKLRASQVLSGQAVDLVSKVSQLDTNIELATARGEKKDVLADLTKQRDDLLNKRDIIDAQMRDGQILGDSEERKLTELEEAVEMLEAAIDFKTDQISSYQEKVEALEQFSEPNLLNKVYQMERPGLLNLLASYFRKVIDLKESEKTLTLHENDLMVQVDEKERVIQDLQHAVHQNKTDFDRRTADIIKEYENKTQLLLKQVQLSAAKQTADNNNDDANGKNSQDAALLEVKIKDLERELYYYKTTSRDLKKKLRELAASGLNSASAVNINDSRQSNGSVASARSQVSNGGNQMNFESEVVVNSPRHSGMNSSTLQQTPRVSTSSQGQTMYKNPQDFVHESPRSRGQQPSVQSNIIRPEKVLSARENQGSKTKEKVRSHEGAAGISTPFSARNSQNCVSVVKSKRDLREIAAPNSVSSSSQLQQKQHFVNSNLASDSMQKDSVDE
ncbi:kinesin-like protein KIF27 [Convolutriloba macropyga]|uniref:kinesin-like protein KIF27 n=1 Tax=Convolutriloba macropyga TaxID=536237 RepID=UPI003F5238BA